MIGIKDVLKGLSSENKKYALVRKADNGVYCGRVGWKSETKVFNEQYLWCFWCPDEKPLVETMSKMRKFFEQNCNSGTLLVDMDKYENNEIPVSLEVLMLSDNLFTLQPPELIGEKEAISFIIGQGEQLDSNEINGIVSIMLGGIIQAAIPREDMNKYPMMNDAYKRMLKAEIMINKAIKKGQPAKELIT